MNALAVGDVEVRYREEGSGRPLLALHGATLDHRSQLLSLEPVFARRQGWRRIYPDLPGHGQTAAPSRLASHDDVVAVLAGFVEALLGEEQFTLAGQSWGAALARGLLETHPPRVDGLLLTVPAVRGSALPDHRVRHHEPGFDQSLRAGEEHQRGFAVWQTEAVLDAIRSQYESGASLADGAFLDRLGAQRQGVLERPGPRMPFERPALIVCGRFDAWCGYDGAYRQLDEYPFATFAVLDGAGHGLTVERESLYHALVHDWLDRIEAETAG